jgi:hypothetical protein
MILLNWYLTKILVQSFLTVTNVTMMYMEKMDIDHFPGDNSGKRKNMAPIQIMIGLHCFHVLFCSSCYSVVRGNQLVPLTVLRHIKQQTSSTWHHRIWNASFSGELLFHWDKTYKAAWETTGLDWTEQFLTQFYSK